MFKSKILLCFVFILIIYSAITCGCKEDESRLITNLDKNIYSSEEINDKQDYKDVLPQESVIPEKDQYQDKIENGEYQYINDPVTDEDGKINSNKNEIRSEDDKTQEVKIEAEDIKESLIFEDEKNENDKTDNHKDIEGVKYSGYKGPVQGEIKYNQGTPAGTNSHEYEASGDIESPYKVELIVTRDFGCQKFFSKNVGLVKDEVGMEVLFRNLDIQTAYGGGFVNSINGLESAYTFFTGSERKKHDWFYWVNGILAPIGVAEYRPEPGDVIWWDYHDWSITMFIPSVIGSYPQPFKNGFMGKNPGTVIMYTDGYEENASDLKKSLEEQGVKQIDITEYSPEELEKPKKYFILLGIWDELAENSDLIKDINRKNKLIGVYTKFEDGIIKALNFKGKEINSYKSAGAIYAYGSSIGSSYPIWFVTGTDDKGVNLALDTLLNHTEQIKNYFGAVISENGVENVPYKE